MKHSLQRAYSELDEKYTKLLGEKAECEYALNAMKAESEHGLKQSGEIRALHENIRKLKHDMKNHLLIITSFLNSGEYDSAKAYTSDMLDKLSMMHSYVETGNSLLNHVLNEKLELARSCGISVKSEIENLTFAKVESLDFAAVLTNLLDNAIEAGKEVPDAQMFVGIAKNRGYETVTVKNKLSASVLERNPTLTTTKPEAAEHGIGVPQIKAMAAKYGGLCDFYENDGWFCACFMLPE